MKVYDTKIGSLAQSRSLTNWQMYIGSRCRLKETHNDEESGAGIVESIQAALKPRGPSISHLLALATPVMQGMRERASARVHPFGCASCYPRIGLVHGDCGFGDFHIQDLFISAPSGSHHQCALL